MWKLEENKRRKEDTAQGQVVLTAESDPQRCNVAQNDCPGSRTCRHGVRLPPEFRGRMYVYGSSVSYFSTVALHASAHDENNKRCAKSGSHRANKFVRTVELGSRYRSEWCDSNDDRNAAE